MGWIVAAFAAVYIGVSALFALWTDRAIEFALLLTTGKVVDVPFIVSWATQMVFAPVVLAFNLATEVARLAV